MRAATAIHPVVRNHMQPSVMLSSTVKFLCNVNTSYCRSRSTAAEDSMKRWGAAPGLLSLLHDSFEDFPDQVYLLWQKWRIENC